MDIGELARIVLRRWYVVVVGLLLTGFLGFLTLTAVQPQYVTTASVLVYRPVSVLGAGGNPFVALGGLEAARDVVLKAINDPAVMVTLSDQGRRTIEVVADGQSSAPIVSVSVTAASPDAALTTQTQVLALVPSTLEKLQTSLDVPKSAQVASVVLAESTVPEAARKSQLRALIGVVGIGVVLTILGAILFDRLRRRARSKAVDTEAARAFSPGRTAESTTREQPVA